MSAGGLSGALDPGALFAPVAGCGAIGLAVSGGADSLALMALAARWAQALPEAPRIVVYSLDHQLRPEAWEEVAFVVGAAARLGLLARGLAWKGEKPQTGLQAAARMARYRIIGQAMEADGVPVLLVAHHLEDQAETVLMRLAHGSGPIGLGGMAAWSEVAGVRIFRPLLGIPKAQLAAEVAAAALAPVHDPGNADLDYERVRWRSIMPELAGLGLSAERLAGFARRMREAGEAIDVSAKALLESSAAIRPGIDALIRHRALIDVPKAIGIAALQQVLRQVGTGDKPFALKQVEALHARLAAPGPLAPETLWGCVIRSDGTLIAVRREPGRARRSAFRDALEPVKS